MVDVDYICDTVLATVIDCWSHTVNKRPHIVWSDSGLPMISVIWTFFARYYGWGTTSEYRLKISDFAPTNPKFQVEGVVPTNHFTLIVRPMNKLQLCRWQFSHTKKLCSRDASSEVRFYTENGRFAFLSPLWGWGLRAPYDDRLRLIGKLVVDFLLVLIELFFARCCGWGVTSEYRLIIGDFVPTRSVWPKISGRRGRSPPTILFLR